MINFKKNIRFKIGSEEWEMPLGVLLLLLGIALVMIVGGIFWGIHIGKSLGN